MFPNQCARVLGAQRQRLHQLCRRGRAQRIAQGHRNIAQPALMTDTPDRATLSHAHQGAAHAHRYSAVARQAAFAPAPGPPLWEDCDAQMDDEMPIESDWDMAAQPAPDFEVDQRVNW